MFVDPWQYSVSPWNVRPFFGELFGQEVIHKRILFIIMSRMFGFLKSLGIKAIISDCFQNGIRINQLDVPLWSRNIQSKVSSSSISFNKKLSSLHPKKLKDYHSRYETRPSFYRKTTHLNSWSKNFQFRFCTYLYHFKLNKIPIQRKAALQPQIFTAKRKSS